MNARCLVCPGLMVAFLVGCPARQPDSTPGDASTGRPMDAGLIPDAGSLVPDASMPDAAVVLDAATPADAAAPDAAVTPDAGAALPDPILFIHGVNGSAADWATMIERFVADGWPRERIMARTFSDPSWGCNVDNANTIATWATELMQTTGATRIDMVAHSMGTLSSRYYVKSLGGAQHVNTYVTVAGMNHGLTSPCFSPLNVCVWKEICTTGPYVTALNADPACTAPSTWVSIYSDADQTIPVSSADLPCAENIMIPGLMHDGAMGVQNSPLVYEQVKRVLLYPGH